MRKIINEYVVNFQFKMKKLLFLTSCLIISLTHYGQDSTNTSDLAKATQNPLAAMYSLPFQNNTTYGNSPYNRAQNTLNIQPVIPVRLTNKINLINRIIVPVITQPSILNDESNTGLGDINWTTWLSPSNNSKIIWGIGPALQLPTATSHEVGSGEFGVGPSVVALTIIKQWVAGIVTNNIWTFGEVEENKFLFQYFVNYNLSKAWYVVSAPILTANWTVEKKEQWTIPFGGGIGKVFKLGKQPININAQVFYNSIKPEKVGYWQSRIQLQFLFPK